MESPRLKILDGWRGISILLVLAAHLLPLGPKAWQLNHVAGVTGMSIFFILSGFLITSLLMKNQDVINFLIKRFLRIVPLAWLFLLVVAMTEGLSPERALRLFSFSANLPPPTFAAASGHFWSLCVEMQFYVFVALLTAIFKRQALFFLPLAAVAITANRIHSGAQVDISTLLRADEILAGCILAMLYARHRRGQSTFIKWPNPLWIVPLMLLASHPQGGWLNYLRPYIALWMIGASLVHGLGRLEPFFLSRPMVYLAQTSYALYIIHGGLVETWLASGDTLTKYMKRPLFFAVTFGLAHVSTFYFESRFIALGKRLTSRRDQCKVGNIANSADAK